MCWRAQPNPDVHLEEFPMSMNQPGDANRLQALANSMHEHWVMFLVEGIASVMYALEHRQQLSGRWGWMLASGIIDLILAAMVFAGLPGSAAWAIGLLVGINMIFGGSALIAMALAARKGGAV